MIRSVDFIGQRDAEMLPARADLVMISITSPIASPARVDHHAPRLLRLAFHDVEVGDDPDEWVFLSDAHAHQIKDFVAQWHATVDGLDLIAHCSAGISRSAAVALFVEAETACSFPRRRLAGQANPLVLQTLSQAHGQRIERPALLGPRDELRIGIVRSFDGRILITARNTETGALEQLEGPVDQEDVLIASAAQRVVGQETPPDWGPGPHLE